MEFLNGQMEECIKEIGKMANKMEKEHLQIKMVGNRKQNGSMERN